MMNNRPTLLGMAAQFIQALEKASRVAQMAIVSQIERNQREHVEAMLRAQWQRDAAAFQQAIYQRRMRDAQS